ncbi:hypothetical protein GN244_ATG16262 [Phytophthora infestans]|uniref:Uncharacterized protein n=1 Tax=Phytophthora infestans TaxID=4787 RepID=A0A833SLA2_PHYIN|nr:hypothetical protein GN244_ATG16262 [Phytophthora infestans]KAF4131066.1 hypothetical protein GN958_ATG19701 [Phytophthora infestans]
MGPDHPSDEHFASNAASDGDASSDREPPRKKTKRGGNMAKAVPKPRKAARGVIPTKPSPKKVGNLVKPSPKKAVLPSITSKKGGKRVKSSKPPGHTPQGQRIVARRSGCCI